MNGLNDDWYVPNLFCVLMKEMTTGTIVVLNKKKKLLWKNPGHEYDPRSSSHLSETIWEEPLMKKLRPNIFVVFVSFIRDDRGDNQIRPDRWKVIAWSPASWRSKPRIGKRFVKSTTILRMQALLCSVSERKGKVQRRLRNSARECQQLRVLLRRVLISALCLISNGWSFKAFSSLSLTAYVLVVFVSRYLLEIRRMLWRRQLPVMVIAKIYPLDKRVYCLGFIQEVSITSMDTISMFVHVADGVS